MSAAENLDFGDVAADLEFVTRATELHDCLRNIEKHLRLGERFRQKLNDTPVEDRVDYNLSALYSINSLFWIGLKLQGIDPSTHPIKNHLQKVKESMQKKKDIIAKRSRPKVDKAAAGRFIRHGLCQPREDGKEFTVRPVDKREVKRSAKKDIIDKRSKQTSDKGAETRFVRNGLWQPHKENRDFAIQPVNKKIKFSE